MSFFYRKPGAPVGANWNPTRMRLLTTAPLILYPLGCVLDLMFPNQPGANLQDFYGLSLITVAIICCLLVAPSYLQRLTGECKDDLDEFEMNLRRKAYTFSYHTFVTVALLVVLYIFIVSDAERLQWMWRPTTSEHWQAILWGGILYSLLIPTAYLAWTLEPIEEDEAEVAS